MMPTLCPVGFGAGGGVFGPASGGVSAVFVVAAASGASGVFAAAAAASGAGATVPTSVFVDSGRGGDATVPTGCESQAASVAQPIDAEATATLRT